MESSSPWKRKRPVIRSRGLLVGYHHTLKEKFDSYNDANIDLDVDTKRAALKVSASVVSLVSFTGEELLFASSGTIIDCENVNGTYLSTILTSVSLLRSSAELDALPDDIKVYVYLLDGKFLGKVFCYDFHFNLATIKIESDAPLSTASLRFLDDSVDSSEIQYLGDKGVGTTSFQLFPHSNLFNLCPGDTVVAIGRFYEEPYKLMAAPGKFSVDCCDFDCKELFKANCQISKCGIGGPLINRYGEVIGVNFYDNLCTPFLPINIACKCFEHFKNYGFSSDTGLGQVEAYQGIKFPLIDIYYCYASALSGIDNHGGEWVYPCLLSHCVINSSLPLSHSVLVDVSEVAPGSPADSAGILPGDVIAHCGEQFVRSFLEFFSIVWDKAGQSLEVVVIRGGARLNLVMIVDGTRPDKFYRWPLPEKCRFHLKSHRPR